MEVGLILKIAGAGILVAVAYQVLSKAGRDEQAMLVSLAGVVIVMLVLVQEIGGLFNAIRTTFGF